MRDFNQANLDAHLAELSANLTPEQAEEFQRTAKQRLADSGTLMTDGSVDGAFQLIGYLAQAGSEATGLPDRIGNALSVIDPRKIDLSGVPGGDLASNVGDAVTGAIGGIGRLFGGGLGAVKDAATSVGSGAIDKASSLVGGADGIRETGVSAASDVLGFSGKALGGAGDALGALKGLIGGGGEAGGAALGAVADLAGKGVEIAGSAGDVADVAGTILGALADVLGSIGDL
jgi:hypothetical protein